jgi:putative transposase
VIEQLRGGYSDRLLREALDVHRSSLYHEAQMGEDRPLRETLIDLAGRWPTYGYRRLTVMLRREGHTVNTKRFRRLMGEMGLFGEPPPRRPRTTDSVHSFPASRTWSSPWRSSGPIRSGSPTSRTILQHRFCKLSV